MGRPGPVVGFARLVEPPPRKAMVESIIYMDWISVPLVLHAGGCRQDASVPAGSKTQESGSHRPLQRETGLDYIAAI